MRDVNALSWVAQMYNKYYFQTQDISFLWQFSIKLSSKLKLFWFFFQTLQYRRQLETSDTQDDVQHSTIPMFLEVLDRWCTTLKNVPSSARDTPGYIIYKSALIGAYRCCELGSEVLDTG